LYLARERGSEWLIDVGLGQHDAVLVVLLLFDTCAECFLVGGYCCGAAGTGGSAKSRWIRRVLSGFGPSVICTVE
jgi:hypothetical protein